MSDVEVIISALGAAVVPTLAFMGLLVKIGTWQGKSEERDKSLAKGMNHLSDRIDNIHQDIGQAHSRIDKHLEGHLN